MVLKSIMFQLSFLQKNKLKKKKHLSGKMIASAFYLIDAQHLCACSMPLTRDSTSFIIKIAGLHAQNSL